MATVPIANYLTYGTHASRPGSASVASGESAFYFETDTGILYSWNGTAWCQVNGVSSQYDSIILNESSLVHYWPCSDAAGSSVATDQKGATNLTANGSATFGARGVIADGKTGLFISGNDTDNLALPSSLITSVASSFSVEFIATLAPINTSVHVFVDFDASEHLTFFASASQFFASLGSSAHETVFSLATYNSPLHFCYTWDTTNSRVYVNSTLLLTSANAPVAQSAAGWVGRYGGSTGKGMPMRFGKFAMYSTALTQAQINTHVIAAGIC